MSEQMTGFFTNNTDDTEPYDAIAAKQKVLDFLGFEPPKRTCGFLVCIALYTRDEDEGFKKADGTVSMIVAPNSRVKDERYRTNTGMVIQMGPRAYTGEQFAECGPYCRVGDWVTVARHEGTQIDYRGKPLFECYDDKIMNVVDDPAFVKRGDY